PLKERRFHGPGAYSGSGVDEAEEASDRRGPGADTQLGVDVLEMLPDGARGEPEEFGNLGIRLAARDPRKHVALTSRQLRLLPALFQDERVGLPLDPQNMLAASAVQRLLAPRLKPAHQLRWRSAAGDRCEELPQEPHGRR